MSQDISLAVNRAIQVKKLIGALVLLLGVGCASLSREQREIVFVESTNLPKADVYRSGLTLLAKYLTSANQAIQIRDEAAGQIVANILPGERHSSYFQAA